VSTKGAPNDGQDTAKILRTINPTHTCVYHPKKRQLFFFVPTSKKDGQRKLCYKTSSNPEISALGLNYMHSVTIAFDKTAASERERQRERLGKKEKEKEKRKKRKMCADYTCVLIIHVCLCVCASVCACENV